MCLISYILIRPISTRGKSSCLYITIIDPESLQYSWATIYLQQFPSLKHYLLNPLYMVCGTEYSKIWRSIRKGLSGTAMGSCILWRIYWHTLAMWLADKYLLVYPWTGMVLLNRVAIFPSLLLCSSYGIKLHKENTIYALWTHLSKTNIIWVLQRNLRTSLRLLFLPDLGISLQAK